MAVEDFERPLQEHIEAAAFRRAVELMDAGNAEALRGYFMQHPEVVKQRVRFEGGGYFENPSLLEFVAENPVRNGKLPANIVDVARVILEAGAKDDPVMVNGALLLVCTGRVARECGVQIPLIDLLCDYGADPNKAMPDGHGEFEAVRALLRRGARMTLPVAAALGLVEEAAGLLGGASGEERHKALALAAQFGHAEIVRLLIGAGEDLNRFNPPGCHAHSTPLHQAAFAGHLETVRLLVEGGARADIEDTMWKGTPLGWALHGEQSEVAEYLRGRF